MSRRRPAERLLAAQHAVELLLSNAEPADWERAGFLSLLGTAPVAAEASGTEADLVGRGDPAVLRLARTAVSLLCSTLRISEQPQAWSRTADLFAEITHPQEPMLQRMRATVLYQQAEAGDDSEQVIDGLLSSFHWHRDTYGHSAYLTSLARTNLGVAYQRRGADSDLALAEELFREEIDSRRLRYGGRHPFVLVARNLLASCLLAQAEAATDRDERRGLSRKAYNEAERARAARDVLYGATASNSTLSRRYQGHALLLVGEPDALHRALACLQHVLAFETERNGNVEWRGSGETHLLLSRVYRALGETQPALRHAEHARRLLCADAPDRPLCQAARATVQEISKSVPMDAGTAPTSSTSGD
jgi:hypothetical protein